MTFSASSSSGSVVVTVNGAMEVTSIALKLDETVVQNPGRLEREIVDNVNKALQKAQKTSSEKMKTIMGGMGLPGM